MPVRALQRTTCSSRFFQISYRAVSQSNSSRFCTWGRFRENTW